MGTQSIAPVGSAPGFIEGNPPGDTISQTARYHLGIVSESFGGLTREPASPLMQRQGQVPMIERRHRADPSCQQSIHQAIVEIETTHIDHPGSLRENA